MKNAITINRYKVGKRGQIGPAWKWHYEVCSPREYNAGTFTLDEARIIAKRRQQKTGYPIVYSWK